MIITGKPNILFLMSDQMRYDSIGCNANGVVKTPSLDRLAAQSVSFSRAHTPAPICVPARACLTTGFYPHKCTGIKSNSGGIKAGFPLLGDELNKRGYVTYSAGKLHYLPYAGPGQPRTTYGIQNVELAESGRICHMYDPDNERGGLEDYIDYLESVGWGDFSRGNALGNNDIFPSPSPLPAEHFVDAWVASRAISHMKEHLKTKKDRPFFMWASFPKPHSAFEPPRPFDSMYDPRTMPDPVGNIGDLAERGLNSLINSYYKSGWDKVSYAANRVIRAFYYGLISFQDRQIGRLLDFLENNGLRENTIVLYTADHGEMMGDFGLYFKKNMYQGSAHIPMMISYPKALPSGKTSDALAGLQDILPTLLSLAGSPLEVKTDGMDLTRAMLEGEEPREFFVSQCDDDPAQVYMVLSKAFKYIYSQQGGVEELYDTKADPGELLNLAVEKTAETLEFRNELIRWCTENGDTGMLENGDLKVSGVPDVRKNTALGHFGRRSL